MEIKIQAVNFDAQEKLQEFVNKKVEKLSKSYDDIKKVEVQLKVVKPATCGHTWGSCFRREDM